MTTTAPDLRPPPTVLAPARPAAVVLTGLLAGALAAVWVADAAVAVPGELWISYHRAITPPYTAVLPPLGGLATIAVLAAVVASWSSPRARLLLLVALACLLPGFVVTVAVHFPINAAVAGWDPQAPPAGWADQQRLWVLAHGVRSVLALAAFLLVVLAGPAPSAQRPQHLRGPR